MPSLVYWVYKGQQILITRNFWSFQNFSVLQSLFWLVLVVPSFSRHPLLTRLTFSRKIPSFSFISTAVTICFKLVKNSQFFLPDWSYHLLKLWVKDHSRMFLLLLLKFTNQTSGFPAAAATWSHLACLLSLNFQVVFPQLHASFLRSHLAINCSDHDTRFHMSFPSPVVTWRITQLSPKQVDLVFLRSQKLHRNTHRTNKQPLVLVML